jgi:hypothetical protein
MQWRPAAAGAHRMPPVSMGIAPLTRETKMVDINSVSKQAPDLNPADTAAGEAMPGPGSGVPPAMVRGYALTAQQLAAMAESLPLAELRKIPPEQLDQLLPYLAPGQVAELLPALSGVQLTVLRPAQLSALSPPQIARIFSRLSLDQIAALKPAQTAAVPPDRIRQLVSELTPPQLRKVIHILPAPQLQPLLAEQPSRIVPGLTARQVAETLPFLGNEQLIYLRLHQLTRLSAEQLTLFFTHVEPGRLRKLVPSMPPALLAITGESGQTLFMPYLKPGQVTALWNVLSDESVRALHTDQLAELTPEQVKGGFERLPPQQWAGLSPGQLAELAPAQMARLLPFLSGRTAAMHAAHQPSALATEQIRQGRGPYIDDEMEYSTERETVDSSDDPDVASPSFPHRPPPVLRVEKPASLSPLQVKQMFSQLTREQLRELGPVQLAGLSGEEIARVLSALSPAEVESLLSNLSKEQIESIPWARHGAWIAHLAPAQIAGILGSLRDEEIRKLSSAHLSALSAKDIQPIFGRLSRSQAQALAPHQLADISPRQLEQLLLDSTPQKLALLAPSLSAAQLMRQPWGRKAPWLSYLTPDQAAWLLPHLSEREVKMLRPIALTALTAAEVSRSFSRFSLEQLAQMRPAQLAAISITQKERISDYRGARVGHLAQDREVSTRDLQGWRDSDLV